MSDYPIDNKWHLRLSRIEDAWTLSQSGVGEQGDGIIIAHTDTGWTRHPEIYPINNYLDSDPRSKNYLVSGPPQTGAEDDRTGAFWGHGTSTASVMISPEDPPDQNNIDPTMIKYKGQLNSGIRVIGVAPKAKILPFRVTRSVMLMPSQMRMQAQMQLSASGYVSTNSHQISASGSVNVNASVGVDVIKAAGLSDALGDMSNLAKAINEIAVLSMADTKIGVVSISLGGPFKHKPLEKAVIEARRKGVIVCAAAAQFPEPPAIVDTGSGMSVLGYTVVPAYRLDVYNPIADWQIFPGSYPHTIRVAGTFGPAGENNNFQVDHKMPVGGFYGPDVDFSSPGFGMHVARSEPDETKNPKVNFCIDRNGQGTSHSTASAAGMCALWLAHHGRDNLIERYGRPLLTDAFRYCVAKSCKVPAGWDATKRGAGIIDAFALLDYTEVSKKSGQNELPTFEVIRDFAASNGWIQSLWGNSGTGGNWGRVI